MDNGSDSRRFRRDAHEDTNEFAGDPRQSAKIDDAIEDKLRDGDDGNEDSGVTRRRREAGDTNTDESANPRSPHSAESSSGRTEPATLRGGNTSETAQSGQSSTGSATRTTRTSRETAPGTGTGTGLFPRSGGAGKPPGCQTTTGIIAMVGLLVVRALRK